MAKASLKDQPPSFIARFGVTHRSDLRKRTCHQSPNLLHRLQFRPHQAELQTRPDGSKSLRNQAITKLRVAIHGKTPKCPGCSYGSCNHNAACRKRFNELLDFHEPIPPAAAEASDPTVEDFYVRREEEEASALTPPPAPRKDESEIAQGLAACAEALLDRVRAMAGIGVPSVGTEERSFASAQATVQVLPS